MKETPEISIIIVSFNTCKLLRECLSSLLQVTLGVSHEIIVIDNASVDQSAEMVAKEFPSVRLINSSINLGFGAANNAACKIARGNFILLLNSDAFLYPDALQTALKQLQKNQNIGLGGARLVGKDGSWQPSARLFPSLLNSFLEISGLADKYPKSPFFGRYNRTWAPPSESAEVDWVPGAFVLIPRPIWEKVEGFDERFFFYCEEVDLCKRVKAAGHSICYWGDVFVTHLGGESTKNINTATLSKNRQLELWRMRSTFLYYRKHHGWLGAYSIKAFEEWWHRLRQWKNYKNPFKNEESRTLIKFLKQAWQETAGGKISPTRPWSFE